MKNKQAVFAVMIVGLITYLSVLAAVAESGVKLIWKASDEVDFLCYVVLRSEDRNGEYEVQKPITHSIPLTFLDDGSTSRTIEVQVTEGATVGMLLTESEYVDMDVEVGTVYFYKVKAVDMSGNISEASLRSGARVIDKVPPRKPGRIRFLLNFLAGLFS